MELQRLTTDVEALVKIFTKQGNILSPKMYIECHADECITLIQACNGYAYITPLVARCLGYY